MPARQGGAVANDVLGCPEDAPIVDVMSHVVIGADDVEVAAAIAATMKSTTCSGVHDPGGFSVRP